MLLFLHTALDMIENRYPNKWLTSRSTAYALFKKVMKWLNSLASSLSIVYPPGERITCKSGRLFSYEDIGQDTIVALTMLGADDNRYWYHQLRPHLLALGMVPKAKRLYKVPDVLSLVTSEADADIYWMPTSKTRATPKDDFVPSSSYEYPRKRRRP